MIYYAGKKTAILMVKRYKGESSIDASKTDFRVSDKYFTHKRKRQFCHYLLLMLNMLYKSLSRELDRLLSFFKIGSTRMPTESPFLKAPVKTSHKVFTRFTKKLIAEFYRDEEPLMKTWNGFRLLGVDTSRITLPHTKNSKVYFWETNNYVTSNTIQARYSILYDIENNNVLDAEVAAITKEESAMALSHLIYCKLGDLILCDRSYPAYDFIKYHLINNLDFLLRVKFGFSKLILDFKKSKKESKIVAINSGIDKKSRDKASKKLTRIKVRLIRIELPEGQVEVLMTSLLDFKNYPSYTFESLYDKRWIQETFSDELKKTLKGKYFSS